MSSSLTATKLRSAISSGTRSARVGLKFKTRFTFDRSVIKKNWKKINETPMKRAGAKVRLTAIRSIRKARYGKGTRKDPTGAGLYARASRPGRPPKSRSPRHELKKIYSVPIRSATAVMVGPVGFGTDPVPTPELHEKGKTAVRVIKGIKRVQGRDKKGRFTRSRFRFAKKRIKYPKRPFMLPALEKMAPKLRWSPKAGPGTKIEFVRVFR